MVCPRTTSELCRAMGYPLPPERHRTSKAIRSNAQAPSKRTSKGYRKIVGRSVASPTPFPPGVVFGLVCRAWTLVDGKKVRPPERDEHGMPFWNTHDAPDPFEGDAEAYARSYGFWPGAPFVDDGTNGDLDWRLEGWKLRVRCKEAHGKMFERWEDAIAGVERNDRKGRTRHKINIEFLWARLSPSPSPERPPQPGVKAAGKRSVRNSDLPVSTVPAEATAALPENRGSQAERTGQATGSGSEAAGKRPVDDCDTPIPSIEGPSSSTLADEAISRSAGAKQVTSKAARKRPVKTPGPAVTNTSCGSSSAQTKQPNSNASESNQAAGQRSVQDPGPSVSTTSSGSSALTKQPESTVSRPNQAAGQQPVQDPGPSVSATSPESSALTKQPESTVSTPDQSFISKARAILKRGIEETDGIAPAEDGSSKRQDTRADRTPPPTRKPPVELHFTKAEEDEAEICRKANNDESWRQFWKYLELTYPRHIALFNAVSRRLAAQGWALTDLACESNDKAWQRHIMQEGLRYLVRRELSLWMFQHKRKLRKERDEESLHYIDKLQRGIPTKKAR